MNLPPTLTEKLDRIPPIIARLFARCPRSGRLLSDSKLLKSTGWSICHLRWVYNSPSWARVAAGDIDKFLAACGQSWSTQRRLIEILKRHNWQLQKLEHLQTSGKHFVSCGHSSMITKLLRKVNRIYGGQQ